MGRVSTAFRAFFAALSNEAMANRIQQALVDSDESTSELTLPAPRVVATTQAIPRQPKQSEAVTLLATLQREARLVDFLKEDLSGYSDDQVGAAVREIHRESSIVLDRVFAIQPILKQEEGADVVVPAGFDAARYRLTGALTGEAPFRGTLSHHGWEVTQCQVPEFVGSESAATTIMPAEVEVR